MPHPFGAAFPRLDTRPRRALAARIRPAALAAHLAGLAVAAGGWAFAPPAHAQAADARVNVDIPAGPLADALNRFALQTGVAMALDAASVKGKATPGLKGTVTVEEGLRRLLQGSGYQARRTPAGYVLVAQAPAPGPAPAAQPAAAHTSSAGTLPEVQVVGTAGFEDANADNYTGSQQGSAATRTDTPLIETPQSVRVVPEALVRDLGATQLADVIPFVSGVGQTNDYGGTWDSFTVRGFEATAGSLLNGFSSSSQAGPRRDTALIEQVEFLKGPNAALYGSSEPGGTYNVVTKKPLFMPQRRVALSGGNLGFRRATLDLTGPVSDALAYRLNVVAEDGAYRTHLADTSRYVLAPAFSWRLRQGTMLTYEADFSRIRTPYDRGLIPVNGDPFALPRDRYLGEPGRPNLRIKGETQQLMLNHGLGPSWTLRAGIMNRRTGNDGIGMEPGSLRADGRTLTRTDSWRDQDSAETSTQADVTGHFSTGGVRHTLLAGLTHSNYRQTGDIRGNPNGYDIDVFDPVYGAPEATTRPSRVARGGRVRALGLYLQDQLALGERWRLLVGVRADRIHRRDFNMVTDQVTNAQSHHATTPRLGLTYMITPDASAWMSYGRSFKPNAGSDAAGQGFDPEEGVAHQAGLKWQSGDRRLTASAAIFDIRKNNVLTRDPANPDFNVTTGQVRSRGLEFDVAGRIGAHWRVSASGALVDAKVTRDNNAALLGRRFAGVARTSFGLFAMYSDTFPDGSPYGVGGGISHVGRRAADAANTLDLPAYTVVRLNAHWQLHRHARLTVAVNNLFDRYYITSSLSSRLQPGLGRQLVVGLQADF